MSLATLSNCVRYEAKTEVRERSTAEMAAVLLVLPAEMLVVAVCTENWLPIASNTYQWPFSAPWLPSRWKARFVAEFKRPSTAKSYHSFGSVPGRGHRRRARSWPVHRGEGRGDPTAWSSDRERPLLHPHLRRVELHDEHAHVHSPAPAFARVAVTVGGEPAASEMSTKVRREVE